MADDIRITEHAMQRFLVRYPSELLPQDPQREIRRLYRSAQPLSNRQRRQYRSTARLSGRYLAAEGWVLVMQHDAIVTVMRKDRGANGFSPEAAAERIRDWQMYRSGECAQALRDMSLSLGTADLKTLARAWREAGMPHHWRGGYDTFHAFWRAAATQAAKR
jgi:hypothetical protein